MGLPARHGWRGWMWPFAVAAMIVAASGRGAVAGPDVIGFDKLVHFFVYGLLATLVVRNGFAPGRAWIAVVLVSVFGVTDEWHQSFTPGREVEVADWIADTLGAIVATVAYVRWPAYRARLESPLGEGKSRIENPPPMRPTDDVA